MGDNTKNIILTGNAADDYTRHATGAKKRRGGRRTRKQVKDEFDEFEQFGGDTPMGPQIPLTQSNTSRSQNLSRAVNITKIGGSAQKGGSALADQTTGRQPAVQLPIVSTAANTGPGTVAQNPEALRTLPAVKAQFEVGTQPNTNVPSVASPSGGGKEKPKVVLAPKKHKSHVLLAPPTSSKKPGTRSAIKETRKVKVHLANMKKRVTTAKIIHKDSKEKSIEEIRKLLEEAKLVKPAKEGKKVPEDILRNIYKDYLILRNKAL